MSQWNTDRLPTQEDANVYEIVIIPCTMQSQGWKAIKYQEVKTGEPWAPWPTMPPFKSDENIARETLPEGYRFVGRGNEDDPIFKSGERSITFFKGKWELDPYPWNGSNSKAFYAVPEEPEEPEPEFWECPEDIPKDALWFLDSDGDCDMIQTVTSWGIFLAQNIKIQFDELEGWRWNDRPFSRFEDGKPCTKETNQ